MKTKFNKMMFAFVAAFALMVSTVSATVVNVQLFSGSWGSEVSFKVTDASGGVLINGNGGYINNTTYDHYVDLADPGCYDANMFDAFGDGWNGGYILIIDSLSGSTVYTLGTGFTTGDTLVENFCLPFILGCMDSLACNYIPNATTDDGGCTYLPVTLNDNQVTCANFSDASLEVIYNTGSYTYQWSNGENTQSIDSLAMGSYSVIVTDTAGCNTILSANVTLAPIPATSMFPEICYIGIDSSTANNKIYIKPMANPLASRFIIYKETSANIYSPIDTINSNVLDYLDVSSNPMAQSYRYKISLLDTCSNESVKSSFHKTIHLTLNLGLNGDINLLWNNYEGYQPNDYLIFRSINNGTMNQIGTLPGTNLTYTDLTPPAGILNYQVRALAPQCNIIPFAKNATNMLTSNIINYSTTYIDEYTPNKELHKITDILGRETKGSKNQPLFYIYDDGTVEKKLIIE